MNARQYIRPADTFQAHHAIEVVAVVAEEEDIAVEDMVGDMVEAAAAEAVAAVVSTSET